MVCVAYARARSAKNPVEPYRATLRWLVPVSGAWRAGLFALATPFQRASWEMATQGFLRGS